MLPNYYQLYDYALERQRELWAEAERYALAKDKRSRSRKAKAPRASRPRLSLLGAARSVLAHLL
jgi:hypothetical protein